MNRFYLKLWLFWVLRVTLCSTFLAALFAAVITLIIYMKQGMAPLDEDVLFALESLSSFWFMILWNFTLLIALFRSVKYIFNRCYSGYKLQLLTCPNEDGAEVIREIGYGDLVKVWRKWFMLLIWLVGALMVIALSFTYLFTSYNGLFEWFNIYVLYFFVLLSGYFSFIILGSRCKKVRLVAC